MDNSEAKTGKLVSDAEEAVVVAEGATYNALPAGEEETPVEPEKPVNPFTDVAETSPYHDAILWAVEQGITQGYEDGTFRPGTTCSHIHILTFLWRAAGSPVVNYAMDL
ncbi:S-layer homology domain-containing protein, partial [uncultured Bifidobacterium sp.]|uniref:S-layer homology domain-containing protein n=1 Tax=uncultured Bifidobacterium sp. TaxID=165187 RepID=UPI002585070C